MNDDLADDILAMEASLALIGLMTPYVYGDGHVRILSAVEEIPVAERNLALAAAAAILGQLVRMGRIGAADFSAILRD